MTIENPLVTVYIPTFNRLELLQRAVKSVQEQTYQNLEIIIVDDCSTDSTQDYLVKLGKEDSRVRYFFKEKNSGACISRNIAIEHAKGEYITGLDDDDFFTKDRIEIFIKSKEKLEKYVFLYSNFLFKNKNGLRRSKADIFKPTKIKSRHLIFNNYVNNQIFIKTKLLKQNLFHEKIPAWQDIYTWYKILNKHGGRAFMISNYTYIMDVSHPHERISLKKIDKINESFNIFCKDFKLNYLYKRILKVQLYNYNKCEVGKIDILLSLIFNLNIYNFISCFYKIRGK